VLVEQRFELTVAQALLIEEDRGVGGDDRPHHDGWVGSDDAVSDREQAALWVGGTVSGCRGEEPGYDIGTPARGSKLTQS
jgi:hypothetical protein